MRLNSKDGGSATFGSVMLLWSTKRERLWWEYGKPWEIEEKGGKRREVLGGVDLEEPRLLGSEVVVQEGGSRGKKRKTKKNKKNTGGRRKVTIVAWQSWRNKQMGEEKEEEEDERRKTDGVLSISGEWEE